MSSTPVKITELTALTTADSLDVLPIVDVSADETKKITKANLLKEVQDDIDGHEADLANPHQVTKTQVGLGNVPNVDTTTAVAQTHTHSNKTILDAITESFTTALKSAYDSAVSWIATNGANLINHLSNTSNPHSVTKTQVGLGNVPNLDTTAAVNNQHTHSNKSTLDLITEAFTTALKSAYDDAVSWISTNGTNLTNHLSDTNNPHSVTKTQVGLSNVTNDAQIPLSQKGANSGVAELDSGGKVPVSQLPSSLMEFKGTWNAATNNPTLSDGTGDTGDVYWVTVGGTRNLGSGDITFEIGDFVIYNGSIWQKSINSNAVVSVNGQQGVVVLDTGDISEVTDKKYVTDAEKTVLSNTSGTNTGDQDLSGKEDVGVAAGLVGTHESTYDHSLIATALQPGDNVITILEATGSVDDSNLAFTFTEKPKLICINGAFYRENHGWTWATLTATLTLPVGTGGDIFGII